MTDDRPFAGIRVLAAVRVIAAPFAAYQLALHGAEVIRIEDHEVPDTRRSSGGRKVGLTDKGMGTGFLAHGANMKSLTVNLRTEEGREIMRKLVATADVFIENFRTGNLAKFGMDYDSLSKINPRLIYCSITGFGQTGPKRHEAATDSLIQAVSGFMSLNGHPDAPPVRGASHVFDYGTGYAAALGISMALFKREKTGRGQHIDASLLETAAIFMSTLVSDLVNAGVPPKRIGNRSDPGVAVTLSISDVFRCKNDTQLFLAATRTHQQERMWTLIGRPEVLTDPRFDSMDKRRENADALYKVLGEALLAKTADEWEALLPPNGVPATKVNTVADMLELPQIKSRGLIHDFGDMPDLGIRLKVPVAAYHLSDGGARVETPPPRMGQNNDEILAELGYGAEDIVRFRRDKVI